MSKKTDLEALIDCYGNSILRFCYLYLLDLEQVQEIVQEVFVRAYSHGCPYLLKWHRRSIEQKNNFHIHARKQPVYGQAAFLFGGFSDRILHTGSSLSFVF